MNYTSFLPIVFCFLLKGNEVLLFRRFTPPWNGSVTVPGGKKEREETALEACVREMKEETGYQVHFPRFRGIAHIFSEEKEAIAFYFSAKYFSGKLKKSPEGIPFWCSFQGSFSLEEINPFYTLLAPIVFDESRPLFEAKIFSDETKILHASFLNM